MLPDKTIIIPPSKDKTIAGDDDLPFCLVSDSNTMDIRKDFSEGNFTKPFFIHVQQVPDTKLMADKKDLIRV
jgi:hypothetical protein